MVCPARAVAILAGLLVPAMAQDRVPEAPTILWHYELTSPGRTSPAYGHGMVYVGGPKLIALNPGHGNVLYEVSADGQWHHPVVHGDIVLARHRSGSVHAFCFTLDRQLWKVSGLESSWFQGVVCKDAFVVCAGASAVALSLSDGSTKWRTELPAGVEMKPATDGERVCVGTMGGTVLALSATTGEILWRFETDSRLGWSNPVIADGTLYVADRGIGGGSRRADRGKRTDEVEGGRAGALHAFDVATGAHRWGRIFGATGFSQPHVAGDEVWGGFGRSVAPFDRETGAIDFDRAVRTGANAFGSPTVIGDRLVFGNLDGHLYVHDVKTRKMLWAFAPGGEKTQVGAFLSCDGMIFVTTTAGLFAIGDSGEEPVRPGTVIRPR